jgi:uncharacterized membrane protein
MSKLVAVLFEEEKVYSTIVTMGPETSVGPYSNEPNENVDQEPDIALSVLENIQAKAKEANVELQDAVVLFHGADGKVKIKQTKDVTTGKGAKRGAFWGLLAGLILGGPIGGLLWGLGIGAVYGKAVDHGIDDKFLKSVGQWLGPRKSAVVIMVQDEDADRAEAYFKTFGTEVHVADLDEEAEKAVDAAAENDSVSQAVSDEFDVD